MKKTTKLILLGLLSFSMISCGTQTDPEEQKIREVYALYQQNGGTKTYEEWLASIKGEKGDKGDKGDAGKDGTDGKSLLNGTSNPNKDLGKDGDSYINTSTWDYFSKENGSWVFKGNLSTTASNIFYEGTCGDNATYTMSRNGRLDIYGTGKVYKAVGQVSRWSSFATLINEIVIHEGITELGQECFCNIYYLKEVTLPTTLTTIGEHAFTSSCFSEIYIPKSVTRIDASALASVSKTIYCEADSKPEGWNPGWSSSSATVIWGCSKVIENNGIKYAVSNISGIKQATVVELIDKTKTSVEIANLVLEGETIPVKQIGSYAFMEAPELEDVILSQGIVTIGNNAFAYCEKLKSIVIPDTCLTIKDYAFTGCKKIQSITIPSSVTELGVGVCQGCTELTSPIINAKISILPDSMFANCLGLKTFTIPNTIVTIGSAAFINCKNLESITIPSSVTSIKDYAFYQTTSLAKVFVPSTVEAISIGSFDANTIIYTDAQYSPIGWERLSSSNNICFSCSDVQVINDIIYGLSYDSPKCARVYGTTDKEIQNINILSSVTFNNQTYNVTEIYAGAFSELHALQTVTVPNTITSIGRYAFASCYSLLSVNIPNGVTFIGSNAFYDCEALQNIFIPNSVVEIQYDAFRDCGGFTIYCQATEKPDGWSSGWNNSFCQVVWGYTPN